MLKKTVKWGILGPGRIANSFADAIKHIDDGVIHAVAGRNFDKTQSFAKKYNISNPCQSFDDLLNDPLVDLIYIASPHNAHYDHIRLCLMAGKAVLCEKPLTVNAGQSRELFELARSKNLFLMEALWTRFLPVYKEVKDWLDKKLIGDIKLMTSTFGFKAPFNPKDRLFNPDLAGGALLDIGIYNISVSQWVKRNNPVTFSVDTRMASTGVDAMNSITLKYADQSISQLSVSLLMDTSNEFIIYGDEGSISIASPFWAATKATLKRDNIIETVELPFISTGFEYEILEAQNCFRNGLLESPENPWSDTQANMELMDNIRSKINLKYPFE
ncbi:MAG: Gfo/Idh/MocA family protein [Methyloligellaceae bacterium]